MQLGAAVASYGTCREIRFLSFERRAELTEPCAVGFTGGADDMSLSCARELNVRFFARIQPYLWDDLPSARYDEHYESSRIEQPDDQHLYLLESCSELNALPIKVTRSRAAADIAPEIWRWYAQEQTFDAGLACRTRNLRSVLTIGTDESRGALLWPIYGLQHFERDAAGMLLVCALAACRCARALRRPIIVCSFSPSHELRGWADWVEALIADVHFARPDMPALAAALARGESALQADSLDRWMRALGSWLLDAESPARVELSRTYVPGEREWVPLSREAELALAAAGPPSVHIVEIGLVPLDIFEHCATRADLPSVVEGQATANFLTALGRPFLQVLRSEHVIKNGYATLSGNDFTRDMAVEMAGFAAELQQLVPTRWLASHPAGAAEEYCARIDRLGQLLADARCDSSAVSRYFALVGQHFRHNKHDKVLAALLALREVMLASASGASR
jgi:hypothetical protein